MVKKSQRRAVNKYNAAHYEVTSVRQPKGWRDGIKRYAAARGYSLAQFIKDACAEKIARDK